MKARVGLNTHETNSVKVARLKMEFMLIFWSHFFYLVYQKELFHFMKMER